MVNILKLFNTLKYLKFKQIYYRIYYLLKNIFFNKNYVKHLEKDLPSLLWKDSFLYQNTFINKNRFLFLNIEHTFENDIDWNFSDYGKLWTFNLNYFDFLNQENIAVEDGIILIKDYIANEDLLKDGKESYTISLRGINWVKFLSKNHIQDQSINQSLYNQYQRLLYNLELHFLGNHYLENGFSLLFGAYYFQDDILYKKARLILTKELTEQILIDGAHFELSPMYHQIMLHRVLDSLNLVESNKWELHELAPFLKYTSIKMLSWLQKVTFKNGNIPMVNDSTYGVAPTSRELFDYAKALGLSWDAGVLSSSGYRKFDKGNFELFLDVGEVGARYQPAHVHSDTFNFILHVKEKPVIVDTGISTYEKNEIRQRERETAAHNTLQIGQKDQTEVWGGFRVAKRAEIVSFREGDNFVKATHNGYVNKLHTRYFEVKESLIKISDSIFNKTKKLNREQNIAYFHFHPEIKKIEIRGNNVSLVNEEIIINFKGTFILIEKDKYEYAIGFNKTKEASKIKVYFKSNSLETKIQL